MASSIKGLDKLVKDLDKSVAQSVMVKTMNTVARKATTDGNRALQKHYNIKTTDLKKYERLSRATKDKLNVVLRVGGDSVPLFKFGGQTYVAKTKGRKKYYGASAKPLKSAGRKRYPNTFPVVLKSGHLGMFSRTGKRMRSNPKRWAIVEHRMITSATMFDSKGKEALFNYAEKKMIEQFYREYKSKFYAASKSS